MDGALCVNPDHFVDGGNHHNLDIWWALYSVVSRSQPWWRWARAGHRLNAQAIEILDLHHGVDVAVEVAGWMGFETRMNGKDELNGMPRAVSNLCVRFLNRSPRAQSLNFLLTEKGAKPDEIGLLVLGSCGVVRIGALDTDRPRAVEEAGGRT